MDPERCSQSSAAAWPASISTRVGPKSNIDTAVGVGEGAHNHGRPNGQDMSSA
jgi:hypothetical protein